MHGRIAISSSAERRIRREARSAACREVALKLRQGGKTYAAIGAVLGVSPARVLQMVRKAERLISESKKGAPATGRPSDSDDPLAAGRNNNEREPWYSPAAT